MTSKPTKWSFNMNQSQLVKKGQEIQALAAPLGHDVSTADLEDTSVNLTIEMQLAAKQRQVMNIAMSPGKNLLTTAFMLWMSGSSIQIFSIMMTGMALINPLKALAAANEPFRAFEKDEGLSLRTGKMIYISLQVLSLIVALYKCSTMGLLPLTSVDWVDYLPEVVYKEVAVLPAL